MCLGFLLGASCDLGLVGGGVDANDVTEGFEFVGGVWVCGGLEHCLPFLEVEDASVRHEAGFSEAELVW